MDEIEDAVEELGEAIDKVACDAEQFSQEQSIEIYKGIISHCRQWIAAIREDMDG